MAEINVGAGFGGAAVFNWAGRPRPYIAHIFIVFGRCMQRPYEINNGFKPIVNVRRDFKKVDDSIY
jgi:hypothetical protein